MSDKYSIGVLVGRFQVHELHEAHHYLINQVVENHKKVILFLGVPKVVGTKKNPLDFETRKKMIQEHYPNITILSLPDFGDDKRWTSELDKRIKEVYPIGEILLYGGRDSFIPYYKKGGGHFDTKELEQHTFVSGTEVRKMVSEEVKSSSDFRAGVIYQTYNQYPKVHPCVDIAPIKDDKVLLAKKPFEDKWRFIGGFVSPSDETLESAAIRKLHNEAGVNINVDKPVYVTSFRVKDWRYQSEEDKIMTTLFKCKYLWGSIEPSQEISELKWFDLEENLLNLIVEEHKELMNSLIQNEK
jgi:bifunctional NMN adenylyltransferase/nudix hydrolase